MSKITRRIFLFTGAAVGAGLALGVGYLSTVDTDGLSPGEGHDGAAKLNAWVEIRPDGKVRIAVPRAEMGQGVYTGIATLIAEELEIALDPATVIVEHPDELLPVYTNFVGALNKRPEDISGPIDWVMKKVYASVPFILTGGSSSIVDGYHSMRVAGATARTMLVEAAAARLGVAPDSCKAENGRVLHAESGRSLSYAEVVQDAAKRTPPSSPKLKAQSEFKLIGTDAVKRVDIPDKTRGAAKFGIDVDLPGMLIATVVQSPVFGGKVKSVDSSAAMALPGVKKVVDLGSAVGVIGETYYHARKAADALKIEWDEGAGAELSSAGISAEYLKSIETGQPYVARNDGDVDAALKNGQAIEAIYETPLLAHACMEPMNTTALWKDGKFEIWSPNQSPTVVRWGALKANDQAKDVAIHTTIMGGGFGRRADSDMIVQAAQLAVAMPDVPVKLVWSREEDTQHDAYRPSATMRARAVLGSDGKPAAIDFRNATQSAFLSFSKRNMPFEMGGDKDPANLEGAVEMPYEVANVRVATSTIETPVPLGFWRSVGNSNTGFFVESFIDELAASAKADPMDYRRELLKHEPRRLAVLDMLKEKSGWATKLDGAGRGRGVSLHTSFRSHVGEVAEVTVGSDGTLKVDRVVAVVDCGQTVNPNTVKAQVEGAVIFALSALMYGEITLEKGRVTQSNFDTYDMVRIAQAPKIEVYIVPSTELPGGIGEPGTPPLFAAVTNAIFAATGKRVRKLPLSGQGYMFA
ncbi:MAG: molybdopterin-dependent oxidoreductase [Alphaproteobacteria bacterium]|nr:molybdopterin-dependent oxidoreductase [Alphaproteobacteria bacterium]